LNLKPYSPLTAGVIINLSMGLLYGWSVLLAPLEVSLDSDRASVSLAYSLATIFFTIGMFVMYKLLNWLSLDKLALAMGALGATGLALAGLEESIFTLIIGFGAGYGFAAGVSYFIAISAASHPSPIPITIAMSINVSAFAVGGVLWPPIFEALIRTIGPHGTLITAAIILLTASFIAFLLLNYSKVKSPDSKGDGLFRDILTNKPRVVIALFVGMTLLAITSLMVIGHASGMAAELNASNIVLAPMITNFAYIAGALLVGQICRVINGRLVLIGISFLTGLVLIILWLFPNIDVLYLALAVIGACWGGCAASYPVTVSSFYSLSDLPRVYGRICIAFGVGGLIGPLAAGALFDNYNSYSTVTIIAAGLGFLAAITHLSLPKIKVGK
tara:strand:- start:1427 stop:2587 length:1161 start_codon:yes stop_codon:yes gene_type:complete